MLSRCHPLVRRAAALVIHGRLVGAVEPSSAPCARRRELREATHLIPLMTTHPTNGRCARRRELREATVALLALHARRELPAATCPAHIVLLEQIPLTPTGKLDRLALRPNLERALRAATHVDLPTRHDAHPLDPMEQAVADVWRRVLGVQQLGRRSSFVRLGGDSIRALQVALTLPLPYRQPEP